MTAVRYGRSDLPGKVLFYRENEDGSLSKWSRIRLEWVESCFSSWADYNWGEKYKLVSISVHQLPTAAMPVDFTYQEVDWINNPPHYTSHPSGVECIDVIEHMHFNLGAAIKYIWRADLKGSWSEDLEKAKWYINREIERRGSQ